MTFKESRMSLLALRLMLLCAGTLSTSWQPAQNSNQGREAVTAVATRMVGMMMMLMKMMVVVMILMTTMMMTTVVVVCRWRTLSRAQTGL